MINKIRKTYFARAFLRTPGQSIRGSINECLLGAGVFLGIAAMGFLEIFHGGPSWFAAISILISIACFVLLVRRAGKFIQGLEGEKYVRDELEPLIRRGYEIINDVPANKFNVDFLVIGPSGIYVIEVKNPTKTKDDKIAYDGGAIYMGPKGMDSSSDSFKRARRRFTKKDPVEQVRKTTEWVRRLLENSGRKKVPMLKPVLLFPKFWVDAHQNGIWVMNSKAFAMDVAKRPEILKPHEVNELTSIVRAHVQAMVNVEED